MNGNLGRESSDRHFYNGGEVAAADVAINNVNARILNCWKYVFRFIGIFKNSGGRS